MTDGESIEARLNRILAQIAKEIPTFSGVAVGDPNGLPIASTLKGPKTLPATALSVMALSVGENVTDLLMLPGKARVRIEGEGWEVVVIPLTSASPSSGSPRVRGSTKRMGGPGPPPSGTAGSNPRPCAGRVSRGASVPPPSKRARRPEKTIRRPIMGGPVQSDGQDRIPDVT